MSAESEIKQSFGFSAIRAMMTPGKKAVLDAVNDLEQHRNDAKKHDFEQALRDRVHDYEAECNWNLLIMKSMAAGALGNFDEAIQLVDQSLPWTRSDQQRAISYSNKGDHCRRSGQIAEAVDASSRAFELWPLNAGVICNYALALAKHGNRREAAQILGIMIENSDFDDPRDVVAAHVKFEGDMRDLLEVLAESGDEF